MRGKGGATRNSGGKIIVRQVVKEKGAPEVNRIQHLLFSPLNQFWEQLRLQLPHWVLRNRW